MRRKALGTGLTLLWLAAAAWADTAGLGQTAAAPGAGPGATAATSGGPLTLYVTRVVRAAPGDIPLSRLVLVSGDLTAQARQTLDLVVARLGDQPLLVPTRSYQSIVESGIGVDAIIVGTRSVVVPSGYIPQGEEYLLDRLADYLAAQGMLTDAPTEITVEQNQVRGLAPQSGDPVFQLQTSRGVTEVSFNLSGSSANSVTGRVRLASRATGTGPGSWPAPEADGVKGGEQVTVLFHKDLISIEMPGRAQGTARVGETVNVYVPESLKVFSGTVTGGKAVTVDLP